MDWMYNSSSKADPEEYLLGKPIDKGHFKEPSPQNFMRSIKDEPASAHSQVELSRRIKEDPLTIIRERELEKKKILWKKAQMKKSDRKLVPVQFVADDLNESESKSIHELIIDNLRQLPYKIDMEKFHTRLKQRKKEKKLRKKRNNSSSDNESLSLSGNRRTRRSEPISNSLSKRRQPTKNNIHRHDDLRLTEKKEEKLRMKKDSRSDNESSLGNRQTRRSEPKVNSPFKGRKPTKNNDTRRYDDDHKSKEKKLRRKRNDSSSDSESSRNRQPKRSQPRNDLEGRWPTSNNVHKHKEKKLRREKNHSTSGSESSLRKKRMKRPEPRSISPCDGKRPTSNTTHRRDDNRKLRKKELCRKRNDSSSDSESPSRNRQKKPLRAEK